ncbi:hypothetical protein FJY94_01140 [Candidatus Kaiserbacteria bacterium]|nr:hypothetical protein [Candidatus Kaiserbacteria bacterium]
MGEWQDIKPSDVLSAFQDVDKGTSEDGFEDTYGELQEESTKTRITADDENADILRIRKIWAYVVLILIVTIVIFDMFLVWQYGTEQWSFSDPTVVIVVITDNFLKIFGLGFLITRETFTKIFKQPL